MFPNNGEVRTANIVENVVTIGAMAFHMDVKIQSCMGIPERTVYYHFKRMQREKKYITNSGTYRCCLLKKLGKNEEKYFSLSASVIENGFLATYDLTKYYELINDKQNNSLSKQGKRKSRKLSLAVAVMHGIGVMTFPSQKKLPMINNVENEKTNLYFYTSREIKLFFEMVYGVGSENEIQYGRFDGFLVTPKGNYVVYVLDKWVHRFNIVSEKKTQWLGREKFSKIINLPSDSFMDSINILRSERMFEDVLRRNDQDEKFIKYKTGKLFDREYCIPLYKMCEILPLITRGNYLRILREKFFPLASKRQTYDYRDRFDGYFGMNEVILSAFDCEIRRIETAMKCVKAINSLKCVLLCFDWQYPYLINVYGDQRIIYKKISYGNFWRHFLE